MWQITCQGPFVSAVRTPAVETCLGNDFFGRVRIRRRPLGFDAWVVWWSEILIGFVKGWIRMGWTCDRIHWRGFVNTTYMYVTEWSICFVGGDLKFDESFHLGVGCSCCDAFKEWCATFLDSTELFQDMPTHRSTLGTLSRLDRIYCNLPMPVSLDLNPNTFQSGTWLVEKDFFLTTLRLDRSLVVVLGAFKSSYRRPCERIATAFFRQLFASSSAQWRSDPAQREHSDGCPQMLHALRLASSNKYIGPWFQSVMVSRAVDWPIAAYLSASLVLKEFCRDGFVECIELDRFSVSGL